MCTITTPKRKTTRWGLQCVTYAINTTSTTFDKNKCQCIYWPYKKSHVDFPAFSLFTKAGNVNEEHKNGTGTVQKQLLFNTNILPNALQT
jgi:hypothetical protein